MLFAGLFGALAVNLLAGGANQTHLGASFLPSADKVARFAGFGLDEVMLTGHKFTADNDIFSALDLGNARSLASFDTSGVRSRLERLPWIATAELTRVWPNRLDVRITERKAFAVWSRGGRDYLIDRSGRVLSAVNRGSDLGLPLFSGEGAATEAMALMTLAGRYPEIASRLEEAMRVGERRWTLKLSGGVTVVLPADREAPALDALTSGGDLAGLLAQGNRIIDLRAQGRVALRTASAGPGARN